MTVLADRMTHVDICAVDDLTPELGAAALVEGRQVALFRLLDGQIYAVDNRCPFSGASVLSRGITGSWGAIPTITSPLHKQVFSLLDGQCLDTQGKAPLRGREADLASYAVHVRGGRVVLEVPPAPARDEEV